MKAKLGGALLLVLAMFSTDCRAEISYDLFVETCNKPSDFCRGLLWGVIESRQMHNHRLRQRMDDRGLESPPPWLFIDTNMCFPDHYERDMERSLAAFLERVRIDVLREVVSRRAEYPMASGRMIMNGSGRSMLSDAFDSLYQCTAGNTQWNLHLGGG